MALIGDRKDSTNKSKKGPRLTRKMSKDMVEKENQSKDIETPTRKGKKGKRYTPAVRKEARKERNIYNKSRKSIQGTADPAGGNTYSAEEKLLTKQLGFPITNVARTNSGVVGEGQGNLLDLTEHYLDEDNQFTNELNPHVGVFEDQIADTNDAGSGTTSVNEEDDSDETVEIDVDPEGMSDAEVDVAKMVNYQGKDVKDYPGNFSAAFAAAHKESPGQIFHNRGKFYKATTAGEAGHWWDGTPYVPGENRQQTIDNTAKKATGTGVGAETGAVGAGVDAPIMGSSNAEPQKDQFGRITGIIDKTSGDVYDLDGNLVSSRSDSSGRTFEENMRPPVVNTGNYTDYEDDENDEYAQVVATSDSLLASGDTSGAIDALSEALLTDTTGVESEFGIDPAEGAITDDRNLQQIEDDRILGPAQDDMRLGAWTGRAVDFMNKKIPDKTYTGAQGTGNKILQGAKNIGISKGATGFTMRKFAAGLGRYTAGFGGAVALADGAANLKRGIETGEGKYYAEAGLDFVEGMVLVRGEKLPSDAQWLYKRATRLFGKKKAQQVIAQNLHKTITGRHVPQTWQAFRTSNKGKGFSQKKMGQEFQKHKKLTTKANAKDVAKQKLRSLKNQKAPRVKPPTYTKGKMFTRVKNALFKNPTKYLKILGRRAPVLAATLGVSLGAFAIPEPISSVVGAAGIGLDMWMIYDIADEIHADMMNDPDFDLDASEEQEQEPIGPRGAVGPGGSQGNIGIGTTGAVGSYAVGGRLYSNGGDLEERRSKPGSSNAGKYEKEGVTDYAGSAGGADAQSYPINSLDRGKSALKLAHNAPDPQGIKNKVYAKYPQLKGGSSTMAKDGGHLLRHNNGNDATYRKGGKVKKKKSSLYQSLLDQENENNNNSGQ